jgi:hypothetical protein
VASNSIGIVLDSLVEFAELDVHGLHSVLNLFFTQLVVYDFLKTHSVVVKQSDEAVVVAAEANCVITALSEVVNV